MMDILRAVESGNVTVVSDDGILDPDSYLLIVKHGGCRYMRCQNVSIGDAILSTVKFAQQEGVDVHLLIRYLAEAMETIYFGDPAGDE
nr:MAG TPA: hypothetical protein [Caudoviricetes sp.]